MVQLLVLGACGRGVHIAADQESGEGEKSGGRKEWGKKKKLRKREMSWREGGKKREKENEGRNQGLGHTLQKLALAS